MKAKQKTTYPLYVFRISSKKKKWLETQIKRAHRRLNQERRRRGKGKYPHPIKKNEIILEALERGLPKVKLGL